MDYLGAIGPPRSAFRSSVRDLPVRRGCVTSVLRQPAESEHRDGYMTRARAPAFRQSQIGATCANG